MPRRLRKNAAGLLPADPADQHDTDRALCDKLAAACPQMSDLSGLIDLSPAILTPTHRTPTPSDSARGSRRSARHTFPPSAPTPPASDATGTRRGRTGPSNHDERTEGVNQKITLLRRQTYGRAGSPLLRQRILLGEPAKSRTTAHENRHEPKIIQPLCRANRHLRNRAHHAARQVAGTAIYKGSARQTSHVRPLAGQAPEAGGAS